MPGDSRLRNLVWADDETLLMEVSSAYSAGPRSQHQYEAARIIAADADGGDMRMLLMDGTRSLVTGADLLAVRTPEPKTVLMASLDFAPTRYTKEIGSRLRGGRKDDGWVLSLFEVDTRTGKGRRLETGGPYTTDWIVDDGQAIARVEWEPERKLFRILRKNGQAWDEIHRQEDGERLAVYGSTKDKSALVAVGAIGRKRTAAWTIPVDGSGPRILLDDPDYDVESVILDEYTRTPIGAWIGGSRSEMRWFDSDAEARHKALTKSFGGQTVAVIAQANDRSRVIARVSTPSTPAIYYLVDFVKGKADIVGEDYPVLANVPMGEVRVISYRSRDGVNIPGYLTLPASAQQLNLPLVVMPHGGPESRDDLVFDWWAQFMASRGYAVLQPQFRGSTGFGEAFRLAGYRQWGGIMQNDVTDGVKALIDQGLVDPRRICIVGASYGGYAALAGAAFTPDLYACAVSVNGISDLPGMLGNAEKRGGEESNALAYWGQHIGSAHDPAVIANSPFRAAERVQAPVLLIHGVNDTVVPIMQSQLMAKALGDAGRKCTFVQLEGEDHWLSRSATRIRLLNELDVFLARYLKAPAQ
ncbi:alpha/beta hydrolase family protein [Povalibacter sp.]|uniref:alpha/beta hydrolase family protein n=1 Tax=Povalibacter sp. TaxID=1962978 RepID=UPI002F415803